MKTCTVVMPRDRLTKVNRLLDIEDIEALDDTERSELGVREDSSEHIYTAAFEDGVIIHVSLYSGQTNYWLEAEYQRGKNAPLEEMGDSVSESISEDGDEFTIDGETYMVQFQPT